MSDARQPDLVSVQALRRMPYYLQYLKKLQAAGIDVVAAPVIADGLNLNEVQVRKDFSAVSPTKGRPKSGFIVRDLIVHMEDLLGYNNAHDAVLVGAGNLGRALLCYKGFESCGMHIVAAFDVDPGLIGEEINGRRVFPLEDLAGLCRRMNVRIGIITVPTEQAQAVCDRLVDGGVLAIWNFAPVHLNTPETILVQNENMAASLALLSKHLLSRMGRMPENGTDTTSAPDGGIG